MTSPNSSDRLQLTISEPYQLRQIPMTTQSMVRMQMFSPAKGRAGHTDTPIPVSKSRDAVLLLQGTLMNLTHLQIIEAVIKNAAEMCYNPDRGLVVKFKAAAALRDIYPGQQGGRSVSGNSAWLRDRLFEMRQAAFEIKSENSPEFHVDGVVNRFGVYADESYGSRTAPIYQQVQQAETGEQVKKVRVGAERTEAYYWYVTFSPAFLRLFSTELGFRYDDLLPSLNKLRNSISGLIARFVISNNIANFTAKDLVIRFLRLDPKLARTRGTNEYKRVKEGMRSLRADRDQLAEAGVDLRPLVADPKELGVFFSKAETDVVRYVMPGSWQESWTWVKEAA